jgi:hypothetical protein
MSTSSGHNPTLPPGETDPNQLYIAVGRAIHAWENMEATLARLYATLAGLPERPDAVANYGAENKIFGHRVAALKDAADIYFISAPNQDREAELSELLAEAVALSIKRHRIAHGYITMWGEFRIPQGKGLFEVTATILYRWGAPWYSMVHLKTDPVGGNAVSI